MAGPDERDLAARFAAGDEAAIRAIYARYAGPILTVAMGTLAKRELADEVVQTTMLKAWRAAASFDPSRDLAPWLYAIARRVAIDVYRRERRAATPDELSDDQVAVVPLSFERTWEAWEVRSALGRLPADEREVVRLAHFLGMTHGEIAEHLGVPDRNREVPIEPRPPAIGRTAGPRGQGHGVTYVMLSRTKWCSMSYWAVTSTSDRQVPLV